MTIKPTKLDPSKTVKRGNFRGSLVTVQATSADGVWCYQRFEDCGTTWAVMHVPTKAVAFEFLPTLKSARLSTALAEAERAATVTALAEKSSAFTGWTVDATAVDVVTQETCQHDSRHGVATVHLESDDDLCAVCAAEVIEVREEPETTCGVEVRIAGTSLGSVVPEGVAA